MEAGSQVVYDGDYKLLSNETEFYERFWCDFVWKIIILCTDHYIKYKIVIPN